MKNHAERIAQLLSKNACAYMAHEVFRDWLETIELTLDYMPAAMQAALAGQPLPDDPPHNQPRWARLRRRYPHAQYWEVFAEAGGALLESAAAGYDDVLGQVYMLIGSPGQGQEFTPFTVALAMAQIIIDPAEPFERLTAACRQHPDLRSLALTGALLAKLDDDAGVAWFASVLLPAAGPLVEPVTVYDPACGSGTLLLAAASLFPRWTIDHGLVRFYGADKDPVCCQMATLNCRLYGLQTAANNAQPQQNTTFSPLKSTGGHHAAHDA